MNTGKTAKPGKDLEEEFFKRQDLELVKKLQDKQGQEAHRDALARAVGVKDDFILDQLLEMGLCHETVIALFLVPVIEVAWADGEIQKAEKEAILRAAAMEGIAKESRTHEMLEKWLVEPPDDRLLETWKGLVKSLKGVLDRDRFEAMRVELLTHAIGVAESARSFLGLGEKVSKKERDMLALLEDTFKG